MAPYMEQETIMKDIAENGNVKWKGLVIIMVGVVSSMLVFTYTHTVSRNEFAQFEKRFEELSKSMNEFRVEFRKDFKEVRADMLLYNKR